MPLVLKVISKEKKKLGEVHVMYMLNKHKYSKGMYSSRNSKQTIKYLYFIAIYQVLCTQAYPSQAYKKY